MRLSKATVGALPDHVARPLLTAGPARCIVHFGIGAFHRAHQAVYTQDAMGEGESWRIIGVSLRSPQVRDALGPQDGLYTVTERANGVARTRLVTVVDTVLVAPEDPAAVIDAVAGPNTHVVTLTITEKGYYRNPATGTLRLDDPEVADDQRGAVPRTIYGYLAAAFRRRRAEEAGGLTLVSCDNLSGNGTLLMRLLLEFLDGYDAALASWTRTHVTAPDTMVDRIVPAPSAAHRTEVANAIGMEDAAAVVTEPFRQWVITDRFAGPRPRWEIAGARIVDAVAPFELAKLRLLNAAHSSLAYIGLQLGHEFVHQAIADPLLRDFVTDQMRAEAVPSLTGAPGLDPAAYIAAIIERFGNADLHHRLDQIATDGSQKLSQRWIATVTERLAQGLDSPCHLTSIAAWITYTAGAPRIADDPMLSRFVAIWAQVGDDMVQVVRRYATELGVFTPMFQSPAMVAALEERVAAWRAIGPRRALHDIVKEYRA